MRAFHRTSLPKSALAGSVVSVAGIALLFALFDALSRRWYRGLYRESAAAQAEAAAQQERMRRVALRLHTHGSVCRRGMMCLSCFLLRRPSLLGDSFTPGPTTGRVRSRHHATDTHSFVSSWSRLISPSF